MCITYLTLKSAKTFREGAQNYSSVLSRFVNCLRGKISLCDLLTLSYPLFSKGELSFCKSCCGWGRGVGGHAWGSICAHLPQIQLAGEEQGTADPCSARLILITDVTDTLQPL